VFIGRALSITCCISTFHCLLFKCYLPILEDRISLWSCMRLFFFSFHVWLNWLPCICQIICVDTRCVGELVNDCQMVRWSTKSSYSVAKSQIYHIMKMALVIGIKWLKFPQCADCHKIYVLFFLSFPWLTIERDTRERIFLGCRNNYLFPRHNFWLLQYPPQWREQMAKAKFMI
jgi:hypothetical protein